MNGFFVPLFDFEHLPFGKGEDGWGSFNIIDNKKAPES